MKSLRVSQYLQRNSLFSGIRVLIIITCLIIELMPGSVLNALNISSHAVLAPSLPKMGFIVLISEGDAEVQRHEGTCSWLQD